MNFLSGYRFANIAIYAVNLYTSVNNYVDNLFRKGRLFLSDQNPINLWQLALVLLEKEMIRPSFETWIKVLSPLSYENGIFEIGTTRKLVKEGVETIYLVIIRKKLEEI